MDRALGGIGESGGPRPARTDLRMAGAESARGPFKRKKKKKEEIKTNGTHTHILARRRASFDRSRKTGLGGAQSLRVREASQSIKIFESNLGNDQPQPNLMDDGEKKE